MARGDVGAAAEALLAFRDGKHSAEADAGAMIIAEFLIRVTKFLTK